MGLLARYSYLLLSCFLIALLFGYSWWRLESETGVLLMLILIALLTVFWVLTRRGSLTPANPEKRVRRARGEGRPLVVLFYADGSLISLLQRLVTAGAERRFRGSCEFIYVAAGHREAGSLMQTYQSKLGQFLLFDARGKLVERTGRITRSSLDALLARPLT